MGWPWQFYVRQKNDEDEAGGLASIKTETDFKPLQG